MYCTKNLLTQTTEVGIICFHSARWVGFRCVRRPGYTLVVIYGNSTQRLRLDDAIICTNLCCQWTLPVVEGACHTGSTCKQ